ncbi:hypothetical protein Mp_2g25000 [Marchantia polymorpha subsp. ruderalis]|uniref:Uncharacterized protein n=1 Tax=Marchantia polymorpha TaxID=3197 RepID=A0A2R6VZG9_MARPO|nr:hypothetical protein MARPO_0245s0005 [Marchantia polymorpha]PTQ27004.1 hypothetical protein MARPO_0245s0005 [Marchantia polymorpha]BBN03629.1 hypothetical protein Mp_2g25000 [Marchantia polymorpha subsp. ruderalis]BBN03630.1 hypothetical protein Mp_2g25000 [Marchantia polymorpha subsp. ruderalis]|eukprot:PTQ27003.1 hypothetical protein MARPO_0245s0005 [Marchantia polymorpha]
MENQGTPKCMTMKMLVTQADLSKRSADSGKFDELRMLSGNGDSCRESRMERRSGQLKSRASTGFHEHGAIPHSQPALGHHSEPRQESGAVTTTRLRAEYPGAVFPTIWNPSPRASDRSRHFFQMTQSQIIRLESMFRSSSPRRLPGSPLQPYLIA